MKTNQTTTINETGFIKHRRHTIGYRGYTPIVHAQHCPICVHQMLDHYEGRNLIIRRLRRQQIVGALLLIVTAIMMMMAQWQIHPFRGGEWKIAMCIAVFIEMYTIFRIDTEMKKEK